jgi:hypothetical protein
MIKRSFSEFHSQRVIPEQQALLARVPSSLTLFRVSSFFVVVPVTCLLFP